MRYSNTYTNAAGCDSVVTANVTINYSSTPTSFSATACDSYTLPWGGSVNTSGAYSNTYLNAAGCDSVVTANVTINYSSTPTSFSATACDSYTLPWGGSVNTSGAYSNTYTNAAGCDSVVTANVTINYSSTPTSFSATACDSYTLPWGGSVNTSGAYSNTYTNAAGCDSVVTANVTINYSSTPTSFSATACDSYTLPWGGSVNTSGAYSNTYTNAAGCDSVVTANVTINYSSTPTSFSATACDSYTLPWGGSVNTSGAYSNTYANAAGCDSVVTANVTINYSSTPTSFSATACDSYTLPWGGSVNTSGAYSNTYTNAAGCDSVVTANVTINYSSTPTSFSATACDSYTLPWGGSVNTSGAYSNTYLNAAGCDSMVTANVTINYSSTPTSFSATACDSYTLPWGGSVNTSGAYSNTYTNGAGCDSVVTANVTINYSSTPTSFSATACDSYTLPWGGSVNTSGAYSNTYANAAGCDSVVTANVTINYSSTPTSFSATACDSYTLPWGGSVITSGAYSNTYTNAAGCDSVVTANVTINYSSTPTSFSATACDSYTLPWGGSVNTSGAYSNTYTNAAGCDSVVTANVTINYSSTPTSFSATACDSYTLPWGGSVNTSGAYSNTYTNAAGCDSVVTANVTINYSSTPTSFSATACDSYTLPWGGSVNTSGAYSNTYTNAAGCDSVVTANVTINYSSTPTSFSATACDSYTLPWGGSVNTSGAYSNTYTNAAGCDSVVTANVTINYSNSTFFNATACNSYVLPWGGSVTVSGAYSNTYTNAAGCDSLVTANVIINYSPVASVTPAIPDSLCNGVPVLLSEVSGAAVSYQWYNFVNPIPGETNSTYLVGGNSKKKYKVVITDINGCTDTSNVVDINRLATPNATILIVNPDDNPDLCINGKVKLRGNGASGITLGYQWHYNGNDIIGATNRDYIATVAGNYRLTVTNMSTGCSKLSAATTVFSGCKDVEIADLQKADLTMYPNPTDGRFMLHLQLNSAETGNATVEIFNSLGQSVLGETLPVTDGELLQEIHLQTGDGAGLYFVRVIFNGELFNGQIVYQH
ncbi:MAG: T9SS type A sorting domain-containing protein [Chitinophagaceae bacterium]|nr:T9SS type A sorting domain-containing protein [Chitinophagaceae bacterium]